MGAATTNGVTQAAIEAIGEDDPGADWILRPEKHADALSPQAGALARVLRQDGIREIKARYATSDARAITAQEKYKRMSRRVIWARLLAILVGGVVVLPLAGSQLLGPETLPRILQAGTVVQYGLLALALFAAAYMSARGFFARWMEARAEAELARLKLFDHVIDADEPANTGEVPLLPPALEYFRRYQLDVQRRYYKGRGMQHLKAAGETKRRRFFLRLGAVLALAPLGMTIAASVGYLDGALNVFKTPWLQALFLALGTAFSAILGAVAAISSMNLDERNAARYLVTCENLEDLAGEALATARAAAAAGQRDGVRRFVDGVQRLISSEHQEWIVLKNYTGRPDHLVDPGSIAAPEPGAP